MSNAEQNPDPAAVDPAGNPAPAADRLANLGDILLEFTRLGITSFGGPIAHLGYFRERFVVRRGWLSDRDFTDLVALCQFLPGPASSQAGFAVGVMRGGLAGGVLAWAGFTLPSVLLLLAFAQGASFLTGPVAAGILHGLKVVAVAVVAQAVWGMARSFCVGRVHATLAVAAVAVTMPRWPSRPSPSRSPPAERRDNCSPSRSGPQSACWPARRTGRRPVRVNRPPPHAFRPPEPDGHWRWRPSCFS